MKPDPDVEQIKGALRALRSRHAPFWVGVSTAGACDELDVAELRSAGPMTEARRAEFAAGRSAAKLALRAAGHAAPVLSDGDGVPIFPDGYRGSIAHKHGRAIAVVTAVANGLGIGIDIEFDDAGAEDDLREEILTPRESTMPDALRASEPNLGSPTTLVLSAKEAIYKAVFPVRRTRFDFDDLDLALDANRRSFRALRFPESDGLRVGGRYALAGPWILCIARALGA